MEQNEGYIVQAVGPIIDVRFKDGHLPKIYTALDIPLENNDKSIYDGSVILKENTNFVPIKLQLYQETQKNISKACRYHYWYLFLAYCIALYTGSATGNIIPCFTSVKQLFTDRSAHRQNRFGSVQPHHS